MRTGRDTNQDTERTSRLYAFIFMISTRTLLSMSLSRTAWLRLNRLRSGLGRFGSFIYKGSLAPSLNCECGVNEQTTLYHSAPDIGQPEQCFVRQSWIE